MCMPTRSVATVPVPHMQVLTASALLCIQPRLYIIRGLLPVFRWFSVRTVPQVVVFLMFVKRGELHILLLCHLAALMQNF